MRIDGADQVISGLEAKIAALVSDNKRLHEECQALRRENVNLNDELDALVAEPQWFSHKGDVMVIVAIVGIICVAAYLAARVAGLL